MQNHPDALAAEFTWSDDFLLGFGPMDHTHEEFVACVRAVLDAKGSDVAEALAAFEAHAQRHFGEEDQWMKDTAFPPRDCHMDEHAAVLKSVHEVQQALRDGASPALAYDLALELARWFPGHADYLDSALAGWMVKRSHGGKPVVLKRTVGARLAAG